MIKVPVYLNFSSAECIGTLNIDETKLPLTPDFCFALGYRITDGDRRYELVEVSTVSDETYVKYVNNL